MAGHEMALDLLLRSTHLGLAQFGAEAGNERLDDPLIRRAKIDGDFVGASGESGERRLAAGQTDVDIAMQLRAAEADGLADGGQDEERGQDRAGAGQGFETGADIGGLKSGVEATAEKRTRAGRSGGAAFHEWFLKKEERVSLPCGPWENGARLEA
jgi:hypothetical protein